MALELFEHQSLAYDTYVPEDESEDEQPPSPQQIDEPVEKEVLPVRPTVGRLSLPKAVRRRATTPAQLPTPAVAPEMSTGSSSPGLIHKKSPEQIPDDDDDTLDQSAYLLRAE